MSSSACVMSRKFFWATAGSTAVLLGALALVLSVQASRRHWVFAPALVPPDTVAGQRAPEQEARRHLEKSGGFSFVPPDTWKVRNLPGLKFKIVVGPIQAGFASNINVVDEPFKGTLDEYVKANTASMMQVLKKFRLVKQEEFKTAAGLQGVRLIVENERNGKLLRQSFYFFGKAGTKYVICGSTLAEGGEKLDPIFERAMKTFRFENQ